ncbi:amidase domain-containing protein [Streptomyces sp. NPDC002574]|uniref:amidase domain-containing protein n=1 Tax=Streptomyces sp. NPDC002574 TaxID=3364652 RepID=UPI0036743EF7
MRRATMVSYEDLNNTSASQWKTAADDWLDLANHALRTAQEIREQGAGPLADNWTDAVGRQAARDFEDLANRFEAAYDVMKGVSMVAEGLASTVELAQRTLRTAVDLADRYGFGITADGTLVVPPPHSRVEAEDNGPLRTEVQTLVDEALRQANAADAAAVPELTALAGMTGVADPAKALSGQNDASHVQMAILAADIPSGRDPVVVRAWWDGLTPEQRHRMMLAEPVALTALPGIPEDAKGEMRGTDGKFDRVAMVQYALDHWDQPDDTDFGNNCTNFVSESLLHAGMQEKLGTWSGPDGDDTWGEVSGTGWDWWDARAYHSDTWAGAENLQNFLTRHGGEEVARSDVRPGDIVFYEQAGPGAGNAPGNTHHAAVVTAVTPDGDIKYTQHSDSYQNVSLDGRMGAEVKAEGQQNLRIVRPHPDWY